MNSQQRRLVKDTWARVLPIREQAAELFYARLFEQYPEVTPYFKGDIQQQGRKLMAMINTAVNGIDHLDALSEPLRAMGARHVVYGVRGEDYDKVAAVLLWTLEQGLGDRFTAPARDAWTEAYAAIAGAMLEGASAVAARS